MASRCISTLNDLDKISNRIYRKHSKGRLRAGIEAKLKASREKAERSLGEIDEGSCYSYKPPSSDRSSKSVGKSSATLSSRYFSTSASTASRPITSECQNKAAKSQKTLKTSTSRSTGGGQSERIQKRKTKSWPSCSVGDKSEDSKDCNGVVTDEVPRTVSFFGKYNGKGSEYKPTAWFNLSRETSVGVIDSFACDAKNRKPLCYSINAKKGESVPNLLRHNLEVRVGNNGIVRTEKKSETMMSELGDGDARQGKKRTAPLSWEEQLHWQNACVISSEPQTDGNSSSKGLCETHPVIFHEKKQAEQEKESKRSEDTERLPAYKVSLENRWVYPDRRNLVSSADKCITSVEIEETRYGDDKAVCSEREHGSEKEKTRDINDGDRVLKKVSFEDERAVEEKAVSNGTEKDTDKNEIGTLEEEKSVPAKTIDTEKVASDRIGKIRPKTSHERLRRVNEEGTKDIRKLRRPGTAPPAPPSSPTLRLYNFIPIKIPTSLGDVENSNFLSENQSNEELSQSSTSEDEQENDIEDEEFPAFSVQILPGSALEKDSGVPKKRVSFSGCKSAPVSRTASRNEERKLPPRAKSSTALQRSPYKPTPPVVVELESSLELPKDLSPAKALVALRKKIRDDLAQQNRELQLDIQQLYLRKHSE